MVSEEGLDLSDPANPKVIGITDTTYSVTVTDGICTATGSVAIQVLGAGVILSITGNPNTCDGTTELVVTGGIGQENICGLKIKICYPLFLPVIP